MIRGRSTLKNWFKTGLKPTQDQFWDWMDSFWHKTETIAVSVIDGLQGLLDNKIDTAQRGIAGGVATLDSGGKVPAEQLPELGGSGSALPLAPATITLWAAGDYRDGQVKTTIASYYDDTTKNFEQRFDWNTDLSVSRIEIKDELTSVWVQRNYTWTNNIPSITEQNITAWTIS